MTHARRLSTAIAVTVLFVGGLAYAGTRVDSRGTKQAAAINVPPKPKVVRKRRVKTVVVSPAPTAPAVVAAASDDGPAVVTPSDHSDHADDHGGADDEDDDAEDHGEREVEHEAEAD